MKSRGKEGVERERGEEVASIHERKEAMNHESFHKRPLDALTCVKEGGE